jgi:predicted amidohydrolase
MTHLPISVAQLALAPDASFDAWAVRVRAIAEEAAAAGSRLLLLPELMTTSLLAAHERRDKLTVASLDAVYRSHFPSFTDDVVALLRELAAQHDMTITGSHLRASGDAEVRNTAFVTQPSGDLVLQDKLHLTPPERAMGIQAGESVETFEVDGVRCAVQICADIEFPEVTRVLAARGVELVLVPSLTWNTRGSERVRIGAHARAMENQLYVAVSTLVATSGYPADGAIHGTGNARVAVPLDRTFGRNDGVWAQAPDTREGALLHTELDTALIAVSREHPEPPGLRYLRPELYATLTADVPQGNP